MNKRISELFDYGDEIVVDERIGGSFDPREIEELTMKKIHVEAAPAPGTRRRLRGGVIAVIAASVCLILCGAAYAAGLFHQQYNWKGEAVGEPRQMRPIRKEKMIEVRSLSDAETIQAILDDREGRELVIVHDVTGDNYSLRSEPVASLEELQERLEAEASPIRAPYEIPEGYVLTDGYVAFDSRGGYTLRSSELRQDGLQVDRYDAPPENDFISGYRLDYENGSGSHLFIYVTLNEGAAYGFSAADGETMTPVAVDGMEEALLHSCEAGATVYMLHYLEEPIRYEDRVVLTHPDLEVHPFTEAYYLFNGRNVDAESLMQMLKP